MTPTSHFIGVQLDPRVWDSLYGDLQIVERDHPGVISVQDPHSPHITLGYLPPELTSEDLVLIRDFLSHIRLPRLSIEGVGYFGMREMPRVVYLSIRDMSWCESQHERFCQIFSGYAHEILDNSYDYVPHITLYRVLDQEGYTRCRDELDRIIRSHMIESSYQDISPLSISLYAVDSRVVPERQVPIFSY